MNDSTSQFAKTPEACALRHQIRFEVTCILFRSYNGSTIEAVQAARFHIEAIRAAFVDVLKSTRSPHASHGQRYTYIMHQRAKTILEVAMNSQTDYLPTEYITTFKKNIFNN